MTHADIVERLFKMMTDFDEQWKLGDNINCQMAGLKLKGDVFNLVLDVVDQAEKDWSDLRAKLT